MYLYKPPFSAVSSVLLRPAIILKVHVLRLRGWWRGSDLPKKTLKPPVALPWRDFCIYKKNVRYTKVIFSSLPLSFSHLHCEEHSDVVLVKHIRSYAMCVMYYRSIGQCVDQILLYLSKKHQDVHDEQHRGQTSQQTGALIAQINSQTIVFTCFRLRLKYHDNWITSRPCRCVVMFPAFHTAISFTFIIYCSLLPYDKAHLSRK